MGKIESVCNPQNRKQIWFTADEHYGHKNILVYDNRPFPDIKTHDSELVRMHNELVGADDLVIHAGDFTLSGKQYADRIIDALNGHHYFLMGSHDKWLKSLPHHELLTLCIRGQWVAVCHYAMRTWPKSHYGAFCLYAHSHGKLPPMGKQHDVGVVNNGYRPLYWDKVLEIMATREDNPNLVKKRRDHDGEEKASSQEA